MSKKLFAIPSSPADQKAIRDAVVEVSNALTRMEAEREFIKEVKKDIKQKYNIPTNFFGWLVTVYHKSSFNDEAAKADTRESLYETIMGPKQQ